MQRRKDPSAAALAVADSRGIGRGRARSTRGRAAALLACIGMVLGMGLAAAPPAAAWQRFHATIDGLALRAGPSTGDAVLQRVNRGTPLDAACAVVGQNINGNSVWLRLTGGQWVSDYFTTSDGWGTRYPNGVPDCNGTTTAAENAAHWAEARVGQVWTSENPNAGWWSGWCEAFVEGSYRRAWRYASAIAHFNAANSAGRIRGGVPPRGAVVFWNTGASGHTGVSVGNGLIVSTQGYDTTQRLPVHSVSYTYYPHFLGWYLP